jgi:hypothetical protein
MKNAHVEIYDMKGSRMISIQQSFSKPVKIDFLKNGSYLLKVTNGKETAVKIFEIQR